VPIAGRKVLDAPRLRYEIAKYLDDFVLVDDNDIKAAIRLLLEHTHNLAEEAGAVSLAAALTNKERIIGKMVVLIMSGGNLSLERLREVILFSAPPLREGFSSLLTRERLLDDIATPKSPRPPVLPIHLVRIDLRAGAWQSIACNLAGEKRVSR